MNKTLTQIQEEFKKMTEKIRDSIDDVTSGKLYHSSEKPSIRDWLTKNNDKHLFETEPYGEPMLDLSEEKVKNFLTQSNLRVIEKVKEMVGVDEAVYSDEYKKMSPMIKGQIAGRNQLRAEFREKLSTLIEQK